MSASFVDVLEARVDSFSKLMVGVAAGFVWVTAGAHVTVWPRESSPGAYEKYVVRVPTEGKVATTSVEIEIPADATFISVGAAIGHSYELRQSGERVIGIVWSMRINPQEFAEFAFMVRNPNDAKSIKWKAVQRFEDGTSTQWSGPTGDKHPASVTTLGASGGHTH